MEFNLVGMCLTLRFFHPLQKFRNIPPAFITTLHYISEIGGGVQTYGGIDRHQKSYKQ